MQIDKFDRLFKTYSGYHHYFSFGTFGRHMFFSGHPHNTNAQENSGTSGASTTSTAPMAPTAPMITTTTSTTSVPVLTATLTNNKRVLNLSTTPNSSTGSPFSQGTKLHNTSQVPPRETYTTAVKEVQTRLLPCEVEELTA